MAPSRIDASSPTARPEAPRAAVAPPASAPAQPGMPRDGLALAPRPDLGQFLNTVVHEQFHCYQHALARGRFPPADPRAAAAAVYRLNERDYQEAPDDSKAQPAQYAAYRRQPSEAHAFMMGERIFQRLFGEG